MKRTSPGLEAMEWTEHMAGRTLSGMECVEKQLQVILLAAA